MASKKQRPSSPEVFGLFLFIIWLSASLAIWYELPEDVVPWMMRGAMIGVLGTIVTMLYCAVGPQNIFDSSTRAMTLAEERPAEK